MTGVSYGSFGKVPFNAENRMRSEMAVVSQKNETMEMIVDIDRRIMAGGLTRNQIDRLRIKQRVLFGKVALMDYGLSA